MGQIQTQDQITKNYEIVHKTHDGMICLKHRQTKGQYILRTLSSYIEDDINGFQQLLTRRKKVHNSHILNVVTITRKIDKQVCSILHKMHVLMEYPFKTLADEFSQKKAERLKFTENQLWSIAYSCTLALHTLYCNSFTHEALSMLQIFIDKQGIIKISDPLILGLEKNYVILLRQNNQKVHVSPEIMSFLIDCSFFYYQKDKSDVYVLGVILLQCACMKQLQIYDNSRKKPKFEVVYKELQNIRSQYSSCFVDLLEKMLNKQPKNRPNLIQLIELIQHQSSRLTTPEEQKGNNNKMTILQPQHGSSLSKISPRKPHFGTVNRLKPAIRQPSRPLSVKSEKYLKHKFQGGINPKKYYRQQQTISQGQSMYKQLLNKNNSYQNLDRMLVSKNTLLQMSPNAKTNEQSTPYYPSNEKFSRHNFGGITINYHPQHNLFQKYNPTQATSFYERSVQPETQHKKQIIFTHQPPEFNLLSQDKTNPNNYSQRPIKYPQIIMKPENTSLNNSHFNSFYQPTQRIVPPNIDRVAKTNDVSPQQKKRIYSFNSIQVSEQKPSRENTYQSYDNVSIRKNFQKTFPLLLPIDEASKSYIVHNSIIQESKSFIDSKIQSNKNIQFEKQSSFQGKPQRNYPKWLQRVQSINYNTYDYKQPKEQQPNSNISVNPQNTSDSIISKLNKIDGRGSSKQIPSKQQQVDNSNFRPNNSIIQQINFNDMSSVKLNQQQSLKKHEKSISPSSDITYRNKIYVTQEAELGRYEGFKVNGKRQGVGRLYFEKGGFYDGEWKQNCMQGQGKLYTVFDKITYEGHWKNGQFDGFGRLFNHHPEKITGQLNYKNLRNFQNYWVYYEGNFQQNYKDGQGYIQFTNNQTFRGNFSKDKIDGRGQFYTLSGKKINGVWKQNIFLFAQQSR